MAIVFYLASTIAAIATLLAITNTNAVHALLYLVVSLLAVAIILYLLGAPFAAALEVIIYAGAIVVLFVFVVMMLNLGEDAVAQEWQWLSPGIWIGPAVLSAILFGELVYMLWRGVALGEGVAVVGPRQVGALFFGPYLLVVELASMLLLAGLVAAYHLGRPETRSHEGKKE